MLLMTTVPRCETVQWREDIRKMVDEGRLDEKIKESIASVPPGRRGGGWSTQRSWASRGAEGSYYRGRGQRPEARR
jgi:hypothetical protein